MKPEVSLPCSQTLATGAYPERLASSPHLPHPIFLRSIIILSFHLCLGFPSDFFLSEFLTTILHAFLISPMHTTCPAHLIFLGLIILLKFEEVYKL